MGASSEMNADDIKTGMGAIAGASAIGAGARLTERQKRIMLVFILLVTMLIVNIPFLSRTALWGADLDYHLFRIKGLADGLQHGQFPVRMQMVQVDGYGYPNSIMYPDALLYIPAVLNLLGVSVVNSYRLFALVVNAFSVVFSYACFKRVFDSRRIGVLAGVLWSVCTYRLADIYSRGAVAEWLALLFFPLLVLGLRYIFMPVAERRFNPGGLLCAVAAAGIVNSHVLSIEMTVIACVPVVVILLVYNHSLRVWGQLLVAGVGALLMSAAFLVPFLDYTMHADMTVFSLPAEQKMALATRKALEPGRMFFLFSPLTQIAEGKAFVGDIPYSLGWATMGFASLWAMMLVLIGSHDGAWRRTLRWGVPPLVMAVMCAVMTTTLFPWHSDRFRTIVAALATIQFPARLTSYVVTGLILLGGLGYMLLMHDGQFARYANVVFAAVLALGLMEGGVTVSTYMANAKPLAPFEQETLETNNGVAGAEYLLAGTDWNKVTEEYPTDSMPQVGDGLEVSDFEKTGTEVTFSVHARQSGEVTLPLFAYPHYALDDSSAADGCTMGSTDSATNLLTVKVPEGFDGTVRVSFQPPVIWTVAFVCSAVSAVGVAVVLIWRWRGACSACGVRGASQRPRHLSS